jgi:hypothetical protein
LKTNPKPLNYVMFFLSLVLYGCVTQSLTLRLSDSRVLRGIFGSKREEVAGGWRRLHNEELLNLYNLPNVIRVSKSRRMRQKTYSDIAGHHRFRDPCCRPPYSHKHKQLEINDDS